MTDQKKIQLADQVLAIVQQGRSARVYRSSVPPQPGIPHDGIIVEAIDEHRPAPPSI